MDHSQPPHSSASSVAKLPIALKFGGRRVTLRCLQSGDTDRLLAFFHSHTPETIYERYGRPIAEMTRERAAALVGVDQTRDAALGVFEHQDEHERLIAVGRYCLFPSGDVAEMAFVVHEQRRRLGIATTLLSALACIAKERGLSRLVAQVEHNNAAMLAIFRRAGATFAAVPGTSATIAMLSLTRPNFPQRSATIRMPHERIPRKKRARSANARGVRRRRAA